MKKINRLPRESATGTPEAPNHDGLPLGADVEGHHVGSGPDDFAPRLPGTGGDFRRPTGSGENDPGAQDVEGHGGPTPFAPRLPGTGGDFRRPSGGGEIGAEDVVEGDDR
jgi:hypothetical protein